MQQGRRGGGRPVTTGKRLGLPEPLASDLLDFRAANYSAPEINVVAEALREHIDRRLEEPEIKKRFEDARRKRLGAISGDNVRVLTPK